MSKNLTQTVVSFIQSFNSDSKVMVKSYIRFKMSLSNSYRVTNIKLPIFKP